MGKQAQQRFKNLQAQEEARQREEATKAQKQKPIEQTSEEDQEAFRSQIESARREKARTIQKAPLFSDAIYDTLSMFVCNHSCIIYNIFYYISHLLLFTVFCIYT